MRAKDQTTEAAAWTAATIAERVEEAMETLKRLPGERPIGFRSTWPDIVRKAVEAYGYNAPEVRLPPPDNQRIDQALEVLDWMLWLRPKEIRLIFARGQGTPLAAAREAPEPRALDPPQVVDRSALEDHVQAQRGRQRHPMEAAVSAYWEIGSAACPELTEVAEFDRLPAIAQAEYRLLRAGIDPYALQVAQRRRPKSLQLARDGRRFRPARRVGRGRRRGAATQSTLKENDR